MADEQRTEKSIFLAAVEIESAADRAAYVEQACAGNAQLHAEVEALLRAHAQPQPLLDASPTSGPKIEEQVIETAGTVIGSYKLIEQIGEGGMGTVWMAQQNEPVKRVVAIKLIKAGMDSKQIIARFEAERQALALMDHPNIAKVLDGGTTSTGRPYFVMDLVNGMPITKYCDELQLTPTQRLELFIPVCQAVQHAHQKGIIHRDLKPTNILVESHDPGARAVPKVIDFGVAKAMSQRLTDRTLFTAFGQMIGTPTYMSPEQAGFGPGAAGDIDTRSDIYSLGVLLYELLTGMTPFSTERFKEAAYEEIRRIIREEDPPKPSTRLSESKDALPSISAQRQTEPAKLSKLLRGELDWIVMKALEKDRNRRYESANSFALDLQCYLADEPVLACPPSLRYKLRKFVGRHRHLIASAVAFALLLLIAAVASTWLALRATSAERATREERDNVVAEKARGDVEASIANAVNEFLQGDLLGQADIANQPAGAARNKDITVRELLDRASAGVDARFRGQEETEAAIRDTLGMAYRALGEYATARKHLERAVALRTEKFGSRHSKTLHSMNNLGSVWFANGEYDKAEALYKQVLEELSAELGGDHPETLMVVGNMAILDTRRARYEVAERRFKQVIDGFRAAYGPDHEKTLTAIVNLAALYGACGAHEEGERLEEQVVAGYRRSLGADHPKTLYSMNNLATRYLLRKRHDKAEPLFEEVLRTRRATLPDGHPDTLATMNDLAVVYQEQRLYAKAEPMFREALNASLKLGAHHPLTLRIKNCLATLCAQRGQLDEAESLFTEVLESRRVRLDAGHPDILISAHNLGIYYRNCGLYEKADPLLVEAADGARAKLTINHPHTQRYIDSLAVLYDMQGRPQLAEPLRRELITCFRKSDGPESDAYLYQLGLLSQNLLLQKKYDAAEPICGEWLAAFDKREPDRWTTHAGRAHLGAALLGQKKYAEAERHLLQAYEGMKRYEPTMPSESRIHLTHSLEWLVQLYDDWGQPQKADQWRKELIGVNE